MWFPYVIPNTKDHIHGMYHPAGEPLENDRLGYLSLHFFVLPSIRYVLRISVLYVLAYKGHLYYTYHISPESTRQGVRVVRGAYVRLRG